LSVCGGKNQKVAKYMTKMTKSDEILSFIMRRHNTGR